MNTRLVFPSLLAAAIASAQPAAPEAAPAKSDNPLVAPEEAKTDMQKWIETTDAQWQAAFKRDVSDVHEADLNKVRLQYLTALEDGIKKASAGNDLKGAVALRDEQKRFGDTQVFPEKDEEADAPVVKANRAVIRVQLAKLEKDNAVRAKTLHAKYDQVLAQAQAQLTKAQRLDDALLLQTKRDEVAAAWVTSAVAAAEKASPASATPLPQAAKPGPQKLPIGTLPTRELNAIVPANSPNAFRLGAVRAGTMISLQYVSGKWKAWGRFPTSDPDDENTEGGHDCRLVISLPSKDGKIGRVLQAVPPNTKAKPFVYEVPADHSDLVLRISGRNNAFSDNPGSVEYAVKIAPRR